MSREEQMEYQWERLSKLFEINPDLYFYSVESGMMMPLPMQTGIDPLTLHYGMFLTAV
jgi:hypothetical protein